MRLRIESWRETYKGLLPDLILDGLDLTAHTNMWKSIIQKKTAQSVYVVKKGRAIIGLAHIGPGRDAGFEDNGEIYAIYLLKAYQGHGIGKRLLSHALEDLHKQGFAGAYLCVLDGNPTIGFYKKQGAKEVSYKWIEVSGQSFRERMMLWEEAPY